MKKPDSKDEKPAGKDAHFDAMGIGNLIYVAGDFAGEYEVLKYDPRTGKWEPVEGNDV